MFKLFFIFCGLVSALHAVEYDYEAYNYYEEQPFLLSAAEQSPIAEAVPVPEATLPPEVIPTAPEKPFTVQEEDAPASDFVTEEEQQQNYAQASRVHKQLQEQQQEIDKIVQAHDQQQRALGDELDTFYKDVGARQGKLEALSNKLNKYVEARVSEFTKKLAEASGSEHSLLEALLGRCNKLADSLAAFRKDLSQVIMNRAQIDKLQDQIRQHGTALHNKEYEHAKILSEANKAKNDIMATLDAAVGKKNLAQVTELQTKANQLKTEMGISFATQYADVRKQITDAQQAVAQLEQQMRQMQMEIDSIATAVSDSVTQAEKKIVKTIKAGIKPASSRETAKEVAADALQETTKGMMTVMYKIAYWVKDSFIELCDWVQDQIVALKDTFFSKS